MKRGFRWYCSRSGDGQVGAGGTRWWRSEHVSGLLDAWAYKQLLGFYRFGPQALLVYYVAIWFLGFMLSRAGFRLCNFRAPGCLNKILTERKRKRQNRAKVWLPLKIRTAVYLPPKHFVHHPLPPVCLILRREKSTDNRRLS